MRIGVVLVTAVMLSGCASVLTARQDVNICYFGAALDDSCQSIEIAENENLVCVDMTKEVDFEVMECDQVLNESR